MADPVADPVVETVVDPESGVSRDEPVLVEQAGGGWDMGNLCRL